MAEDDNKKTTPDDVKTDSTTDPVIEPTTNPVIEEAKKVNEKKEKLLEREEALQARKEKFNAEQMVGGNSQAGQDIKGKETPSEKKIREESEGIINAFR